MTLANILSFAYLFFGMIVCAILLLAAFNIFTKGYRPKFSLIVIGFVSVLILVNFVAALVSIQAIGSTSSPSPTRNSTPDNSGNFF